VLRGFTGYLKNKPRSNAAGIRKGNKGPIKDSERLFSMSSCTFAKSMEADGTHHGSSTLRRLLLLPVFVRHTYIAAASNPSPFNPLFNIVQGSANARPTVTTITERVRNTVCRPPSNQLVL
jgi:hypothetical protein